jgi:hypothetical protein
MVVPSDHGAGIVPIAVSPPGAVTPLQKKIFLVSPWQKNLHPLTAFCVAQLHDRRRTYSALSYGDAFVAHTRNTCADQFLKSDCDWMLTVDDDMIVPFGNAEWYKQYSRFNFQEKFLAWNAIDRLLSHGKTLVGALYKGRHPDAKMVYNEAGANPKEDAHAKAGPHDICKPTRWVGTGCMLIHRKVFLDIEKRFPRLARKGDGLGGNWFTSTEASLIDTLTKLKDSMRGKSLTGVEAYQLLDGLEHALAAAAFENPLGVGEDVSFCLRAQAAGHTPHVDLGLRCGHVGNAIY